MKKVEEVQKEIKNYITNLVNARSFIEHINQGYFPFILTKTLYEKSFDNYCTKGLFILSNEDVEMCVTSARQICTSFYELCYNPEYEIDSIEKFYNIEIKKIKNEE